MFEAKVNYVHRFDYHPHDFAVAFTEVVAKKYGPDALRGAKPGPLARRGNVQYLSVPVGHKMERKVVSGPVEISGIKGVITTQGNVLGAVVRKSDQGKVEELAADIKKYLETRSIYRAKGITVSAAPEGFDIDFLEFSGIDRNELVFSPRVWQELEDNVWTLVREREEWRKKGMKIQRKVLFAGKHGVGKTVAALVTGKMGIPLGWTYVQVEPSLQPSAIIEAILDYSSNYEPVILNIEDFDREQREGHDHALSHLMSSIDGALSKSRELFILFTTNFPNKLASGMNRPGRIDAFINFDDFGPDETIALLGKNIPAEYLSDTINWSAVTDACTGYSASFVREIGVRATFQAHNAAKEGGTPRVTEDMLIAIAADLKRQHEAAQRDGAGFHPPS